MQPIKPRYEVLDGLRGVAALIVLCYHICEAIAFAPLNSTTPEQGLYHGFLAVDFFFILSGFVMGYAYDERLADGSMTLRSFIRRRLVRLHPMVVMGVVMGVVAYLIQGGQTWDGTHVATSVLMLSTLLALFCLPTPTSMDVRGNTEAFPINGPHWSLFLEYLGSLLYGMFLHRVSQRVLRVWVALSALLLLSFSLWQGEGTIGYGWSSEPWNMLGGMLRISFGYPMGLLLARRYRQHKPATLPLSGGFWIFSALLLVLFLVPGLGALSSYYQVTVVCLVFPMLVWQAARVVVPAGQLPLVRFLGRLSYPLYAVHYPLIYLYIYWIQQTDPQGLTFWGCAVVVFLANVLLGTLCLLWWDEPVRKKLSRE